MGDINTNIRIDELETVVENIKKQMPFVVEIEVDLTTGNGDLPEGYFDMIQTAIYKGRSVVIYAYGPIAGNQPPKDREIYTFASFFMNASQIASTSGEVAKTLIIRSDDSYEIS